MENYSMQAFRPQDPAFAERVRDSFGRQVFMRTIGASLDAVRPGECEIRLPVTTALGQQHGYVHAGVTSAIADTAAGYAAFTLFPEDSEVLTIEFKINLLAPADAAELVARARVIRAGRTVSVVQSDVFGLKDGVEKHVATMQASMICLRKGPAAQ
jgi:uncharacterized protein (TIGR00369 family)